MKNNKKKRNKKGSVPSEELFFFLTGEINDSSLKDRVLLRKEHEFEDLTEEEREIIRAGEIPNVALLNKIVIKRQFKELYIKSFFVTIFKKLNLNYKIFIYNEDSEILLLDKIYRK